MTYSDSKDFRDKLYITDLGEFMYIDAHPEPQFTDTHVPSVENPLSELGSMFMENKDLIESLIGMGANMYNNYQNSNQNSNGDNGQDNPSPSSSNTDRRNPYENKDAYTANTFSSTDMVKMFLPILINSVNNANRDNTNKNTL